MERLPRTPSKHQESSLLYHANAFIPSPSPSEHGKDKIACLNGRRFSLQDTLAQMIHGLKITNEHPFSFNVKKKPCAAVERYERRTWFASLAAEVLLTR